MGVQRDVRGAFEVVGVLVEAHFSLVCLVGGLVGLVVLGACGARLVDVRGRYCCRSWQVIDGEWMNGCDQMFG